MGLFDGAAFAITEQGLDAAWYKQQIIRHNIACVTVPDYKAKTVEFGLVLKETCRCKYHQNTSCPHDRSHTERDSSGRRIDSEGNDSGELVRVRTTYETNTNQILNGNNVDMEKEATDLADVQFQYGTMIDYMNSQYAMIRSAIRRS